MEIDLERLRELMQAMGEFDVTRVELEDEEERLVLERGHAPAAVHLPHAVPSAAPPPAAASAPQAEQASEEGEFITSPFVGTFYSAPSPETPPFVSVGAEVTPGQTLCIVEAMKLMNEIECEHACQILEVLIENGQPVEFGARLFRVAPR